MSLRGGPECVPGVLMELMGGPGGGLCWKLWGGYGALGEWYGGMVWGGSGRALGGPGGGYVGPRGGAGGSGELKSVLGGI